MKITTFNSKTHMRELHFGTLSETEVQFVLI